jgi:hypothetical protein
LRWLGLDFPSGSSDDADEIFDESLRCSVEAFQVTSHHRVHDGLVGPGTRERLVRELLHRFDPSIFQRLYRRNAPPSVFISYASIDSGAVNKLDQWLRDHKLRVIRDCQFFVAGSTIEENIGEALAQADKILAVLSKNSRDRDWPRLERVLTEEIERKIGARLLIYLCLDESQLPAHDSTRLAIRAAGKPLKQVGAEVLHAVAGVPIEQWQYAYDEDEILSAG